MRVLAIPYGPAQEVPTLGRKLVEGDVPTLGRKLEGDTPTLAICESGQPTPLGGRGSAAAVATPPAWPPPSCVLLLLLLPACMVLVHKQGMGHACGGALTLRQVKGRQGTEVCTHLTTADVCGRRMLWANRKCRCCPPGAPNCVGVSGLHAATHNPWSTCGCWCGLFSVFACISLSLAVLPVPPPAQVGDSTWLGETPEPICAWLVRAFYKCL